MMDIENPRIKLIEGRFSLLLTIDGKECSIFWEQKAQLLAEGKLSVGGEDPGITDDPRIYALFTLMMTVARVKFRELGANTEVELKLPSHWWVWM
jgi:hypothetical protein